MLATRALLPELEQMLMEQMRMIVATMRVTRQMIIAITAMMTRATMTTMLMMTLMTSTVRFSFCPQWFRRSRLSNAAPFPPTRAHAGVLCAKPSSHNAPVTYHRRVLIVVVVGVAVVVVLR